MSSYQRKDKKFINVGIFFLLSTKTSIDSKQENCSMYSVRGLKNLQYDSEYVPFNIQPFFCVFSCLLNDSNFLNITPDKGHSIFYKNKYKNKWSQNISTFLTGHYGWFGSFLTAVFGDK